MERAPSRHAPAIPRDAAAPRSDSAGASCPARPPAPYLPRRPQESPLCRVLSDHFDTLERVHEECFEPTHGPLRRAARAAVGRFMDCGLLEHGFAGRAQSGEYGLQQGFRMGVDSGPSA